uniref:Uncharacterized protein n=1 Tax=Oryza punctata TaxID=4537 RepID=A0A0E0M5Z0_ORYPU
MKPGVLELQQAGVELLGTGRRCRAPAAALGKGRWRRAPTAGRYVGDRVGLQPAASGSSRSNGKGRRRWVQQARWGKGGGGGVGSSSRDGERAAQLDWGRRRKEESNADLSSDGRKGEESAAAVLALASVCTLQVTSKNTTLMRMRTSSSTAAAVERGAPVRGRRSTGRAWRSRCC